MLQLLLRLLQILHHLRTYFEYKKKYFSNTCKLKYFCFFFHPLHSTHKSTNQYAWFAPYHLHLYYTLHLVKCTTYHDHPVDGRTQLCKYTNYIITTLLQIKYRRCRVQNCNYIDLYLKVKTTQNHYVVRIHLLLRHVMSTFAIHWTKSKLSWNDYLNLEHCIRVLQYIFLWRYSMRLLRIRLQNSRTYW